MLCVYDRKECISRKFEEWHCDICRRLPGGRPKEQPSEQIFMNKKGLVLDLNSIPHQWGIRKILEYYNKQGYLFWDSFNGGQAPYMINKSEIDAIVIDISTEEGKQKLIEIEEKFNKENNDSTDNR